MIIQFYRIKQLFYNNILLSTESVVIENGVLHITETTYNIKLCPMQILLYKLLQYILSFFCYLAYTTELEKTLLLSSLTYTYNWYGTQVYCKYYCTIIVYILGNSLLANE